MIFGAIAEFISGIFTPAKELISEAIPDKDLRAKLDVEINKLETDVKMKMLALESEKMNLQMELSKTAASVAQEELKSDSWLAKNYRPIITLCFGVIIVAGSFGLCKVDPMVYDTFGLIFGIYGSSRGLEKVASIIKTKV